MTDVNAQRCPRSTRRYSSNQPILPLGNHPTTLSHLSSGRGTEPRPQPIRLSHSFPSSDWLQGGQMTQAGPIGAVTSDCRASVGAHREFDFSSPLIPHPPTSIKKENKKFPTGGSHLSTPKGTACLGMGRTECRTQLSSAERTTTSSGLSFILSHAEPEVKLPLHLAST